MASPISDSRRLLDEVGSGDPKRALEAIRDRLIVEFDQAPTRYMAALARVLLEVLKDLQGLPSDKPGRSVADEIAARRDERLLTTRGTVPAQRNGGREREQYRRRSGKPKSS